MKKLLTLLSLILVLGSCTPEITRFSYKENPLQYKDIETNGELKVEGRFAYMKTIKGTPMIIDLTVFNVEKITATTIKVTEIKSDSLIHFKKSDDMVVINHQDMKD